MNQNTFPGSAPFNSITVVYGKLVKVDAAMKVNPALLSPLASSFRVRPELKRNAPEGVQYAPVVSLQPPIVKTLVEYSLSVEVTTQDNINVCVLLCTSCIFLPSSAAMFMQGCPAP